MKMPFGRYRGVELRDIPEEYARWILPKLRDRELADPGCHNFANLALGTEVFKRLFTGDLDTEVREALRVHRWAFPSFDADRVARWAEGNRQRKFRLLWLGVAEGTSNVGA